MKISVIGTGYVGLVAGACLADCGHKVVCVDLDNARVQELLSGRIPIFEPGLAQLVQANQRESRLTFTSDLKSSLEDVEVVFIAVGTPERGQTRPLLRSIDRSLRTNHLSSSLTVGVRS